MVAQAVAIPVVKWIFTTAIDGLFGGRRDPTGVFTTFFDQLRARQQQPPVSAPPIAPPPAPIPAPSGPSIPDRMGVDPKSGYTIGGIRLPQTIPGSLPASIPGWGSVITRVLGPTIAGGLLWPLEAGRGSDLRDKYGMPAPAAPGRRRGARPRGRRARARPRAVGVPGVTVPVATPKGRGRPVTISQPVVRPGAIAIPNINRRYPVQPVPGPVKLPAPAPIPRTAGQTAGALARLAAPYAQSILQGAALAFLMPSPAIPRARSTVASPATPMPGIGVPPSLGSITLPGQSAFPTAQLNLAAQPLTAFQYAPAQSPAQELDDQCKARAREKRKKRKPKDRSVCYRGTFIEKRRGTSKSRKEKIPCR